MRCAMIVSASSSPMLYLDRRSKRKVMAELTGTRDEWEILHRQRKGCLTREKDMAIATEALTYAVTLNWPLTDDQFAELCVLNPDMRFEYTSTGDLIIMPPTGGDTSERNASLTADFVNWNRVSGMGVVYDSSGGFILPNGAKRSPDVAWLQRDRRDALTAEERRGFIPLCPDFVLELFFHIMQCNEITIEIHIIIGFNVTYPVY